MTHVLGSDYSYITLTSYNRLSFSKCCLDAFRNIDCNTLMTVRDIHNLYMTICPDFDFSIIEEAARYITPKDADITGGFESYIFEDLQLSILFQLFFSDWLKMVALIFQNDDINKRHVSLEADNLLQKIIDRSSVRSMKLYLPMDEIKLLLNELFRKHSSVGVSYSAIVKCFSSAPSIRLFLLAI